MKPEEFEQLESHVRAVTVLEVLGVKNVDFFLDACDQKLNRQVMRSPTLLKLGNQVQTDEFRRCWTTKPLQTFACVI